MKRFVALLAILCGTMAWSAASAEELHATTITIESLLTEMTDCDAVARLPEPWYVCKQASSHDRATKTPDDPEGWFANRDYGQFLRTEQNAGRTEWVIMEHDGPGAVTRFWLPLNPAKDDQAIRFYFDGATTPAIAVNFNGLLSGRGFVKPPLAFVAWNETDLRHQMQAAPPVLRHVGGDLYLPIPFAKSCKITLDQVPFYYIIDYRIYAPGTVVKTFTMSDYEAAADTLKRVGEVLTATPSVAVTGHAQQATLAPGEQLVLDLPGGEAAIRNLQVRIDPPGWPDALARPNQRVRIAHSWSDCNLLSLKNR